MRKTLTVNGTVHEVDVGPTERLADTLRRTLSLTGTKIGCGVGECGACTVLVGERPVMACLTLTSTVTASIVTVEGLPACAHALGPHFASEGGFQCGFCTPGQMVSAYAYVHSADASADDDSVREAMSGNVCRCTGYAGIVRAVQSAIREGTTGGCQARPTGREHTGG